MDVGWLRLQYSFSWIIHDWETIYIHDILRPSDLDSSHWLCKCGVSLLQSREGETKTATSCRLRLFIADLAFLLRIIAQIFFTASARKNKLPFKKQKQKNTVTMEMLHTSIVQLNIFDKSCIRVRIQYILRHSTPTPVYTRTCVGLTHTACTHSVINKQTTKQLSQRELRLDGSSCRNSGVCNAQIFTLRSLEEVARWKPHGEKLTWVTYLHTQEHKSIWGHSYEHRETEWQWCRHRTLEL